MTEMSAAERDASPAAEAVLFTPRPLGHLWPTLLPPGILLVLGITTLIIGPIDSPLQVVLWVVIVLTNAVPQVNRARKARRQVWAVRVGPGGITWADTGVNLPWGQLTEVRTVRPWRWPFGRTTITLMDRAKVDYAEQYGTRPRASHRINTRLLRADPRDVVEAITRFSDVPIAR